MSIYLSSIFLVPTAAPSNIRLTDSTDTSLEISWDEVPCEDRNGRIQLYLYHLYTANSDTTQPSLAVTRTLTRENLACNTEYRFRVAARNLVGEGPYSADMIFQTDTSSSMLMFAVTLYKHKRA